MTPVAMVKVDPVTPEFAKGEMDARPRPAPTTTSTSAIEAAPTAPAMTAAQEIAGAEAGSAAGATGMPEGVV